MRYPENAGPYAVAVIAIGALFMLTGTLPATPELPIGAFSKADVNAPLMGGWKALSLGKKKETRYELVEDDGTVVVRATSRGTASGLVKPVQIDPRNYPVLTWRWKISNVLEKGNVAHRSGDDYPARIYVTFAYDPADLSFKDRVKYRALRLFGYDDIPLRALNYIWANRTPEDTIVPNSYTDWVRMVVVQNGPQEAQTWQAEARNIYEDYKAAFGEEPGLITGIAMMTDTDNTGEAAMAYYGDISMRQAD